ncbi:313_t:CDS:2, partial [Acaulospora colombiana]
MATELIKTIFEQCGLPDASFIVEPCSSARTGPTVTDVYFGTTTRCPGVRKSEDLSHKATTRLTHFLSSCTRCDLKVYEIVPWRTSIQDRYDFRQGRLLSDLELMLTLVYSMAMKSALGGFIARYQPPPDLLRICKAAILDLPPRPEGSRDVELAAKLSQIIDEEKEFFDYLREETSYDVGEEISDASFASVKHHLLDRLFSVNGVATSLSVLRDVTREEFLNEITPGFFSPQKGRAMAAHHHMLGTALHQSSITSSSTSMSAVVYSKH